MKKSLVSPLGLKPQGVGPQLIRISLPFLVLGIIVKTFWPYLAYFPFLDENYLKGIGIVFLFLGILGYIISLYQLIQGFPKGELVTQGVFRISRNPIYACWILLIFPGLAFMFNNWLFLLAALAMWLRFRKLIYKEEIQLLDAFGNKYYEYSKKVRRII